MNILDSEPLNRYDFSRVSNMWEKLVIEAIAAMIERKEMCECHDCVLDTLALSLNSLPPRYWILGNFDIFGSPDDFYKDSTNKRMAEQAAIKAYQLVESNPHH